jgi:hypothetical protein
LCKNVAKIYLVDAIIKVDNDFSIYLLTIAFPAALGIMVPSTPSTALELSFPPLRLSV